LSDKILTENFVAKCRNCTSKITIPDQGPCTDLEFMDYITASGKQCKCGKNDWGLLPS
jgi:hypothetical protein|tara:strand:- start:422 stop:595 length:174 start_codon:yes stop_codon:yes gene_type:complete